MNKYKVSIVRIEHTVYQYDVEAKNEGDAELLANELFDDTDLDKGEIVHGENFVNQIEIIK
jgi:hypothetical protein